MSAIILCELRAGGPAAKHQPMASPRGLTFSRRRSAPQILPMNSRTHAPGPFNGKSWPSGFDPESGKQFALAQPRHRKRSAVEVLIQPLSFEHEIEKRGAKRSTEMRTPLAPVEARTGKLPSQSLSLG